MPVTTSSIPAVKAALVELITAALATAGANGGPVQVSYGWPGTVGERELVYAGNVEGRHEPGPMTGGRKRRDETYAVEIVVEVVQPRGTAAAAEDRAFELLTAVEDTLANNPSLGGIDGLMWARGGEMSAEAGLSDEGPMARITYRTNCHARLS